MPSADQPDVRDLLEAASRTSPREPDPVAAVVRRHAQAPRLLTVPGAPRRSALLAAATVVAVAASAAVVAVAVSADPSGGGRRVAGPVASATPSPSMTGQLAPGPPAAPAGPTQPSDPATGLAATLAGFGYDLRVAHALLVDECAASQGVDVTRGPSSVTSVRSGLGLLQLWLGTSMRTGAAAPSVALGDLSAAAQGPYDAASDGGCSSRATAQLYGVPAATYEATSAAVRDLDARVRAQVATDPAVVAALPAWSACLGTAGLLVDAADGAAPPSSPEELEALATQLQQSGADGEQLADLASTDAHCRASSGLGAAALAAATRAAAGLSGDDRATVAAWSSAQRAAEALVFQRAQRDGGDWEALRG